MVVEAGAYGGSDGIGYALGGCLVLMPLLPTQHAWHVMASIQSGCCKMKHTE